MTPALRHKHSETHASSLVTVHFIAANRYLEELDATSVTEQINAALKQSGGVDDSHDIAVESGRQLLLDNADEW